MSNSVTHASLPYPIRGARFTLGVPFLDADGDPTDPVTPDTEVSIDGGAYADCTEEESLIVGANGSAYITLTGDELTGSLIFLAAKVASGPKNTLATLYPRVLPLLRTFTATGGGPTTILLDQDAVNLDDYYNGCIVKTTGGTGGGGGFGNRDNQARVIKDYVGATRTAVVTDWDVIPDATTTAEILQTELTGHVLGTVVHSPALPSQIDIANMGLVKIGDKQILTFEDDTDHARVVKLTYDRIVDSVLRTGRWRFATRQAALAQLTGAPTWRYLYRYQLPTDPFCLKVTRVSADLYNLATPPPNPTPVWEIQGRELLANETPVTIEYIARITDPSQWDSLFTDCLVERLAMEWAIPVTQQIGLRTQAFQAYKLKLDEARSHDGFEGTPDIPDDTTLLDVR